MTAENHDFSITSLGSATIPTPIKLPAKSHYVDDSEKIAFRPDVESLVSTIKSGKLPLGFEVAGPREHLFFDPTHTRAAIVTCGGLCPGLNAVIRALVHQLWFRYSCTHIEGVRGGYHGLSKERRDQVQLLTPDVVYDIHQHGGTMLGTSRGTPPTEEIVSSLIHRKINLLFAIGGDGTMRGAHAIHEEFKKRGVTAAVIGIPKTIDNDIPLVRRTFGFETAVSIACEAIRAAHVEAESFANGVGLVRLMGRESGYIAANASLASGHANFCLIPEVPFRLEGPTGLLALAEERIRRRGHVVIVTAEGAGQEYFRPADPSKQERDPSGNVKLGDIGLFLKEKIMNHFKGRLGINLKYIDPSYLIRAQAANPGDQLFCGRLAQCAVHAGMVGKTDMLVGYWHGRFTHVPMAALGRERQSINPTGELWFNVLETTGQPAQIG